MEEIEYLEEYEEIVMPQLLHTSIQEFLPTDDPYDLLPVDPAFDEFIEEDPLCSVYRNDFQFQTTLANNNNGSIHNNNSATGEITTLSPSIVTVSAGDGVDESTIITGDVNDNNIIIIQQGITTTAQTTLMNMQTNSDDDNSDNNQLEYIPTEIVDGTVTYDDDNNDQQQHTIDNNDELQTLSEIQNNNESNINYDNSYLTTSSDNDNGGSGVKVLSCETLGTTVFLTVGSTISTSSHEQQNLLTTPIQQTTIIDSPKITTGNRLIGTTSEYIRATHSSNNSINTNLSLLGLPLSPPALQYQPTPTLIHNHLQLQPTGHNNNNNQIQQFHNSSSLSTTTNSPQHNIIATNTTNRSKKLSTIYQNNDLYPQILALKSGLKLRKSSDKFKSLFRNKFGSNLKGFDKLRECSMRKSNNNYRLQADENRIIAIRSTSLSLKRDNLKYLFKSNEKALLKSHISYEKQIQNSINNNADETSKMTIEKITPLMSKGSLKQYEEVQNLQVKEISEDPTESLTHQQQFNEEYINDTTLLNNDISTNENDNINNTKELDKDENDIKVRENVIDKDKQLKGTNDQTINSDTLTKLSKSVESLSKHDSNIDNNNSTLLKIDKLATDLIVAKNTSLKLRKSKSLTPIKDLYSDDNCSTNKYYNMMKLKFSKSIEKVSNPSDEKNKKIDDNKIKAISTGSYKKSEFKSWKKSKIGNTIKTNNNNIDEKHYDEYEKSKKQIIHDVLNSPKVLRVVLPRTSALDQIKKTKNILKMDSNDTEKSNNEQQQKELEDPLKCTVIDPLKLDDDETVSHFQYVNKNKTNQLEKYKNKCNQNSTSIEHIRQNESQSSNLILNSNNLKSKLTSCDPNSTNILNDNKLHDNEITKLNDSKLIEKTDKNKSSKKHNKNINRISKSSQIIQENNIILKEKNIVKDNEMIGKKQDNLILTKPCNEEKIISKLITTTTTTTTTTKPEIFTIEKLFNQEEIPQKTTINKKPEIFTISKSSLNQEKLLKKPTNTSTTSTKKPDILKIGKSISQEKISERTKAATITTTKKPEIITNAKTSNQEKIQEETKSAMITTSKKPEIFTIAKSSNSEQIPEKTKAESIITTKKPEIFTIVKSSNQDKIPEKTSTETITRTKKPEMITIAKSFNQEKIAEKTKAETITTSKKPEIFRIVKSSNQEKIQEKTSTETITTTKKPEIFTIPKFCIQEKLPDQTAPRTTTNKNSEIFTAAKSSNQEKIPVKPATVSITASKPQKNMSTIANEKMLDTTRTSTEINKNSENLIVTKSVNEERISDTKPRRIVPINEKASKEMNIPKIYELVRSKRIASRSHSTDSHTSSLKDISVEAEDPVEQILYSVRKSRECKSISNEQIKYLNRSTVINSKTSLTMESKPENLRKSKRSDDSEISEVKATRHAASHNRTSLKNRDLNNKEKITENTSTATSTNSEIVTTSIVELDYNKIENLTTNIDKNLTTTTTLQYPHLTRHRTARDTRSKNINEQLIGINQDANKLNHIKPVETLTESAAERTVIAEKSDDNCSVILSTDKQNKNENFFRIDKEVKTDKKDVKEANKNTESELESKKHVEGNQNVIKETEIDKINVKNISKKECESPADLYVEEISLNVDKSIRNNVDKHIKAEIKPNKRQNRELKLLQIDSNIQSIFIEPTMAARSSRSRSKRSAGGNLIQIAPEKPAAKIIRRRQSNILQISRKEYDRVINERRSANDVRIPESKPSPIDFVKKDKFEISPPIPVPINNNDEQEENRLKILEYEGEQIKKHKIKKCKIVLHRVKLKYKKRKSAIGKLYPSLKIVETTKELPKLISTADIINSNKRISGESNSSIAGKKRKLNSSVNEVTEPKILRKSGDNQFEESQENRKLSTEVETTKIITEVETTKEENTERNLISAKSSNDNGMKAESSSDKLNKSNFGSTILIKLPKQNITISKELPTKVIESIPIIVQDPKSPDKCNNKSVTLEPTIGTEVSTNSETLVKAISLKLETDKTTPINKSREKNRIFCKFLPLKTDKSKKKNDGCTGQLKKYKSTPNLNLLNDDVPIKSKNEEVTTERTTPLKKQIELSTNETINLPITQTGSEKPTLSETCSKRKILESKLTNDNSKKQKLLSPNDETSAEISSNKSTEMTETITASITENQLKETNHTASHTLTKSIVQTQINSKPQIFIAAPENIPMRLNSETNLNENGMINNNNSTGYRNLDFSIESWFQDIPPLPTVPLETSTPDLVQKKNLILSTTNTVVGEDTIPPLTLAPISSSSPTELTTTPTRTQTGFAQISKSTITLNKPLLSTAITTTAITNQQTKLPELQTKPTHSTSDLPSYSITTPPSTFHIPNIKSINIPAHIVVQTKFLTREQYMSKLMKNTINTSSSSIPSSSTAMNNNLISGTSNFNVGSSIGNVNSDQRSSVKILETISDLLETHIDSEVRRKMQDLIENKSIEDRLRIERLTNIKKIGYTSDFSLQMLVFLQNYFFNTSTVMDNIRNIDNISGRSIKRRNISNELPANSSNIIKSNEDFTFRKIRLPVQNINNNNKTINNNLQPNLPFRTTIISKINKNLVRNQNNYPMTGTITVSRKNNTPMHNRISTTTGKPISTGVIQSDGVSLLKLSNNMPSSKLNDNIKRPSLVLTQSTSSCLGQQIHTDVFLNSTNNTCEAAITYEPESILPDSQTIAPPILQPEIKEETVDESIIS